ncbi:unnamed protein product [Closterium sp. NIES-54]
MPRVSTLPHQERVAVPALEAELQQLRARHEVALVMVGERNERVDELEADLADVRALYKEQVALLAAQVRGGRQAQRGVVLGGQESVVSRGVEGTETAVPPHGSAPGLHGCCWHAPLLQ